MGLPQVIKDIKKAGNIRSKISLGWKNLKNFCVQLMNDESKFFQSSIEQRGSVNSFMLIDLIRVLTERTKCDSFTATKESCRGHRRKSACVRYNRSYRRGIY